MTWVRRPPRCKSCGQRGELDQVPTSMFDWIWLHSSCSKTYVHKPKRQNGGSGPPIPESTARAPFFAHPLLRHRRGGGGGEIGFIRSNNPPTDAQGWFPLSTST